MKLFLVYAGARGGGLESTLALYGTARKIGMPAELVLSADNERREKIERVYPEASFHNFLLPNEIWSLRKRMSGGLAFMAMMSPKAVPLYLSLDSKKAFYFHATYDYSFGKRLESYAIDFLHDLLIRESDLALATQALLAWQIRYRLGVDAELLPHPPYSAIRPGFFLDDEPVDVPFEDYFLTFGGIDRRTKGTDLLLKAAEGSGVPLVLAGRRAPHVEGKNVHHIDRWLSDGQLYHLIRNARCVVLPYLVSSQFSGCLALSYIFRKPAIVPFCPAFERWVDNGKTGLFFSQGDADDLRAKMKQAWAGKAGFDEKAIGAKNHQMERYSADRMRHLLGDIA